MTLPFNPQAAANSDRLIIETLKTQGEQLTNQTEALKKLITQLSRQGQLEDKKRNNQKASTKTSIENNSNSADFSEMPIKDLPKNIFKMLFGPGLDDIQKSFKSKREKPKAKEEVDTKEAKKEGEPDVLKEILEKFVTSDKFQEKMKEDTKALLMIADSTKASMSIVKDDLEYVKRQYEDGETDKNGDILADKISAKLGNNTDTGKSAIPSNGIQEDTLSQLPEKIGKSISENLSEAFERLLTISAFKEITEKQTDKIVEALQAQESGGDDGGIGLPDMPDRGRNRSNRRGRGPKGRGPKGRGRMPKGGTPKGKLPMGKIALGAASGFILYEGLTHMEDLNAEEDEDLAAYREENPELFKKDQDILNDPNASKDAKLVAEKNLRLQQDIQKYGEEEAKTREIARNSVEERLKQRKAEKAKIETDKENAKNKDETGKPLEKRKWSDEAGPQAPLTIPMELGKSLKEDSANNVERLANPEMDETGKPLEPVSATAPALLNNVTEEKQDLTDNKPVQPPITVINNNTNNMNSGGGQAANFASASAVNKDSAINDFFRSHGKIFA